MRFFQRTLADKVMLAGYGTHNGKAVTAIFSPAPVNTGLVFVRVLPDEERCYFPVAVSEVGETNLCTCLGLGEVSIATIEHAVAALVAYGIDNVYIEVDANEMPILDGSSVEFLTAFQQVGYQDQTAVKEYIRILKPVEVHHSGASAGFYPYQGTRFDVTIDFPIPLIGRQSFAKDFSTEMFEMELSRARTFGFFRDAEILWKKGFARGTSLENSIIINEDGFLMNADGLRYPDEFVRHKTLDAVGDTALLGRSFLGVYRSFRAGHLLNSMAVSALLADTEAYEICVLTSDQEQMIGEVCAG